MYIQLHPVPLDISKNLSNVHIFQNLSMVIVGVIFQNNDSNYLPGPNIVF